MNGKENDVSEDSLDVYIRSLVIEAINLESADISIKKSGDKLSIEMKNQGEWLPYPHPPKAEFGDLLQRLREMAGVETPEGSGESSVLRKGEETVPLELSFSEGAVNIHIRV